MSLSIDQRQPAQSSPPSSPSRVFQGIAVILFALAVLVAALVVMSWLPYAILRMAFGFLIGSAVATFIIGAIANLVFFQRDFDDPERKRARSRTTMLAFEPDEKG